MFDGFLDTGPQTTAVSGTQTIRVHASNSNTDFFDVPFGAEGTPPLQVEEIDSPSVIIRANGEGSGYLRIFDPGSLELFDRISITAASIQSIRVVPVSAPWFDPEAAEKMDWALLADSHLEMGVVLRSSDKRLVDESMTFDVGGSATSETSIPSWDKRSIFVGAAGSVEIFVQTGSGDSYSDSMPIVGTLDDIEIVSNIFSPDTSSSIPVGTERVYCFRGLAGNRAVGGLSWSVSVEGSITAKPVDMSCFGVKASAPGIATLIVSAGGFKKDFSLTITQSAGASPPLQIVASDETSAGAGPAPGQRAR